MKIPEQAKKVFTGEIFDVYHWDQEMFDGSKATFEMLKRPDTVEIIATQDDKILLAYEEQPTKDPAFTPFGGRVDPGEDSLTAAKRELKEEAGLESDDWQLLRSWRPNHKVDWEVFLYAARNCKKVCEPHLDPGEKIETRIVDFEEFTDIVTGDNFWGKELAYDMMRMKADGTLDEFKKEIKI